MAAHCASKKSAPLVVALLASWSLSAVDFSTLNGYYLIPTGGGFASSNGTVVSGITTKVASQNTQTSSDGRTKTYSLGFVVYGTFGSTKSSYESFNCYPGGSVTFTQNADLKWEASGSTCSNSPGTASIGTWVPAAPDGSYGAHWATAAAVNGQSGESSLNMTNFYKGFFDWCLASTIIPSEGSFEFWLAGANWSPGQGLPSNNAANVNVNPGGSTGNGGGGNTNSGENSGNTTNQTTNATTVNENATNITNTYGGNTQNSYDYSTHGGDTVYNYNSGGGGGGTDSRVHDDLVKIDEDLTKKPDSSGSAYLPGGDANISQGQAAGLAKGNEMQGAISGLLNGSDTVTLTYSIPFPGIGPQSYTVSSRPTPGSALDTLRLCIRALLVVCVCVGAYFATVKTIRYY